MTDRPPDLRALLDELSAQLPKLLGRDLVGIYIYGSLTQGAFQPERSELQRGGSDGNPIPWLNILEIGITLYGPQPSEFVPEITPAMITDTMVRELGYLSEELAKNDSQWRDLPKYRAYAVLTVCRILYTLRKGKVVSKPRAAIWALRSLPEELHTLINAAVAHDAGQPAKLPLREVTRFVRFAQKIK